MPIRRSTRRSARRSTPFTGRPSISNSPMIVEAPTRVCHVRELGLLRWAQSEALQREAVQQRIANAVPDQLLLVEHPHVVTMGRNGHMDNLIAGEDILARTGIDFHHTTR